MRRVHKQHGSHTVLRTIHASGITIESLFDRPLKTSCGAALSSRVYVRKVRFCRVGDEPLSHAEKNSCPDLQSFVLLSMVFFWRSNVK
jgi:hypothetical protein